AAADKRVAQFSAHDQLLNTMLFLLIGIESAGLDHPAGRTAAGDACHPARVVARLISVVIRSSSQRVPADKARRGGANLRGPLALTLPDSLWAKRPPASLRHGGGREWIDQLTQRLCTPTGDECSVPSRQSWVCPYPGPCFHPEWLAIGIGLSTMAYLA